MSERLVGKYVTLRPLWWGDAADHSEVAHEWSGVPAEPRRADGGSSSAIGSSRGPPTERNFVIEVWPDRRSE